MTVCLRACLQHPGNYSNIYIGGCRVSHDPSVPFVWSENCLDGIGPTSAETGTQAKNISSSMWCPNEPSDNGFDSDNGYLGEWCSTIKNCGGGRFNDVSCLTARLNYLCEAEWQPIDGKRSTNLWEWQCRTIGMYPSVIYSFIAVALCSVFFYRWLNDG